MRIVSLASGSGGNAYIVESANQALLIDCGISFTEMKSRLQIAGIDPAAICAVLFTHEHIDHIRAVRVFHKRLPQVSLFANFSTADAIESLTGVRLACFENGQAFEIGPFTVEAFSIPHDVCDPVGFMVRCEGKAYFHATDVGTPLDSIGRHLAEADIATLESNHDLQLLMTSARPEHLKKRIRGPRGHLSNDESASLVRRFASPRLEYLALAHLSGECNAPRLASAAATNALREAKLLSTKLEILSQDTPSKGWSC